jgi:hypothetical protein
MTNDKLAVAAFAALARDFTDAPSAECQVEFFYPAGAGHETVVRLPFVLGPTAPAPWPIGAVTGLRGVGVNPDDPDQPTCRFTLERDTEANVALLLEFTIHLPPTPEAATTVLKQAAVLSEHYVRPAPR